jgi:hypothetical protein
MKAHILDHVIKQGNIGRRKPLQDVSSAKRHPQPKALRPRAGKEVAPAKPFRVRRIVQIKVADIADMLNIIEKKGDNSPVKVEQLNPAAAHKRRERQVPGKCFASEAADDNLFMGGGHGAPGLSHGRNRGSEKGATPVVNTPMLCYTYVLCLRVMILINT